MPDQRKQEDGYRCDGAGSKADAEDVLDLIGAIHAYGFQANCT
jgi:hypothetical protein